MIDTKLILEDPKSVEANNLARNAKVDISLTVSLSQKRSELIDKVQTIRTRANEVANTIQKASADERVGLVNEGKKLKDDVKVLEVELAEVEKNLDSELRKYPNILQFDVPIGKDETANEVVRVVGEPTKFSFEPLDHQTIGENLGLIDIERAVKVSGPRFAYLKGDLVLLEFALIQYILSITNKYNFVPVLPPHIISTKSMSAMGYLDHGGEEEVYHLKNDEAVLIGTSEQAIGPMYQDEILDVEKLPFRYVGFSPCYRREAGSYGRDVKGILRMHQFDKVEMFSFTAPETSNDEHLKLLSIQEELMQGLKLPYRVLKLCSGDTGAPSSKTFDIETWIPSQKMYRETHSTSNTTDYQARRLNIRIKRDGKSSFVHTLNATAFAMGRIMIAIMENYQQENGSVVVPEVLKVYVGKEVMGK